ncbi:MAG: choice-of-anchor D domain-containing protein [Pseudomonadota bacterium]
MRFCLIALAIIMSGFISQRAAAQVFPTAVITPDLMEFPNTRIGTTADTQNFTVTKTQSVLPLYIFSAKIGNTQNFSIVNDACSGVVLYDQESCTVGISFSPDQLGHYSTNFTIIDTGSHIVDTALIKGRGVAPEVTLSTTSIDFGHQTINKSSSAYEVLLTNSGNEALAVTSIQASDNFTVTDNCGTSVDAQASCMLGITFDPTAAIAYTGTVTITDDAADSPQTISLIGTGINPGQADASLSTHSLNFGNQQVGTTSQAKSITLTNTGTVNLTINAITPSANFAQTDDCGAALAADAQCTINVTFTPLAAGSATGTLLVDDNATDSPQSVNLAGQGIENTGPQANLSATTLDFGQQTVHQPSDPQTVTLTNGGDEALVIQDVETSGDDSHSYSEEDTCHGSTIAGGSTCRIEVTFTPAEKDILNAVISITDNTGTSPQTISLTGIGIHSSGGCQLMSGGSQGMFLGYVPLALFLCRMLLRRRR